MFKPDDESIIISFKNIRRDLEPWLGTALQQNGRGRYGSDNCSMSFPCQRVRGGEGEILSTIRRALRAYNTFWGWEDMVGEAQTYYMLYIFLRSEF